MQDEVPHTSVCQGFSQLPLIIGEPFLSENDEFILRYQKHFVTQNELPEDANTIPSRQFDSELKGRHLSRREAIELIATGHVFEVLHAPFLEARIGFVSQCLKELCGLRELFFTTESSLLDHWPEGDTKQKYYELVETIFAKWQIDVCPGCLYEAKYIWREADIIQKYQG